jgi:hypothetical protein
VLNGRPEGLNRENKKSQTLFGGFGELCQSSVAIQLKWIGKKTKWSSYCLQSAVSKRCDRRRTVINAPGDYEK